MVEAMRREDIGVNRLGTALDQALSLANTGEKIHLPKTGSEPVKAVHIFEGAAVENSLKGACSLLEKARKILVYTQPELDELNIEGSNPQDAARAIKRAAWKSLRDVEVQYLESGQNWEMAEAEMEEFLRENPEVMDSRKAWAEEMAKTSESMAEAAALAGTCQKKAKQQKDPEVV
jgi:hypothetical protein